MEIDSRDLRFCLSGGDACDRAAERAAPGSEEDGETAPWRRRLGDAADGAEGERRRDVTAGGRGRELQFRRAADGGGASVQQQRMITCVSSQRAAAAVPVSSARETETLVRRWWGT